VLGLDNKVAASRPVVLPVQTADAKNITLKMGGVSVDTKSGAKVTYKVWSGDTPGAKTTPSESAVAHDSEVGISMPLPSTGVMYYTIEAIVDAAK